MELHKVPISSIQEKDERFRTAVLPSKEINLSIERVGLLQPLRIVTREAKWVLLSGWKRFWASKKAKLSSLPVLILDQPDDLMAFESALDENLSFRSPSVLEKANALRRLCDLGRKEDRLIRDWLPRLGIPATSRRLDLYLHFASWGHNIQKDMESADVPLSAMEIFAKFPSGVQREVLPLLAPLSHNKKRELLDYLREVSILEGLAVEDVLHSKGIEGILGSDNISKLQKADALRKALHSRRYPKFSSWVKEYESLSVKIPLPRTARLDHFPNFEEGELTLALKFRTIEQYRDSIDRLREVADNTKFQALCRKFCND
jgi:hypothetical protein